ncbi:hypothetical protein JQU52_03245 [Paralysiella testudinis]|uniref:Acyltransferase n=2 Tax=Paralysiella testudinis TaxID=2809020 RepID=A0A892ZI69_9NEIS|nr:hypothetical protein JQU52_03245 [Paralysiella testudinis]
MRASFLGVKLDSSAKVSLWADIKYAAYIGDAVIGKDVSMGKGSYVNSGCIFSAKIGEYCSIAYNVLIGPTEHDISAISMSPNSPILKELNQSADLNLPCPIIEDEVWIGANVVVLRGVTIGKGSVVAAGAVVTKNIPPMEIWGGIPAKKIKARIITCLDVYK